MPVAIPLQISLDASQTEERFISADDILSRITLAFPQAVVDWERGKQRRLSRIEELLSVGCPEVLLANERRLVDKTAFVGVDVPPWTGNSAFGYVSGIDVELEGLGFELECYDIQLLKHSAHELANALSFTYSLHGGGTALDTHIFPGSLDGQRFVNEWYRQHFETTPRLIELPEWKSNVHRGIIRYLDQYKQRSVIDVLTTGFKSYADFATQAIVELTAISPINTAYSVDTEAPFGNAALLDHGDWYTHISLSGVPRGILA